MIAALYVETNGAYYGLDGVDPWDQVRDARLYDGPHPVVAHPPCQRWGKMWFGQPLTVKETGQRKTKGSDAGCFAAAMTAVRNFGGVLEHPWGCSRLGVVRPDGPRPKGWLGPRRSVRRMDLLCRTGPIRPLRPQADPPLCGRLRLAGTGLGPQPYEPGPCSSRAHGPRARQAPRRGRSARRRHRQHTPHPHPRTLPRPSDRHGPVG